MISQFAIAPPAEVHAQFAERAAQLHLLCWCLDKSLNVTLEPPASDAIYSQAVTSAAATARHEGRMQTLATGHFYEFLAIPDEFGAVVVRLPKDLGSLFSRNQLVQILQNAHSDLCSLAQTQRAIEGFNGQLSQSYEEVNLIFRMSRFLEGGSEPLRAIQTLCEDLCSVLNYGWVTLVFQKSDALLTALRGSLVSSGQLPCPQAEFLGLVSMRDITAKVLEPATDALAARAGGEILVRRVTHGSATIALLLAGNRQGIDPDVSSNELQLVEAAVGFLELFHQNAFRFAQQRQQFLGTLHALTSAVDAKDPYTHGHSERVGLLAAQLAAKLGFDAETVEATRVAGLLHDIGKIGVPEAVLTKPAKLTDQEFELIKQHPVIGHKILSQLPSLNFQLPGVLHHHERWDGRGYPHQLCGGEIPLVARLLAFADTFDAMSSNRAYRSAMTRGHVLEEIVKSSGTQFDPSIVGPFITLDFQEFDARLKDSTSLHEPRRTDVRGNVEMHE